MALLCLSAACGSSSGQGEQQQPAFEIVDGGIELHGLSEAELDSVLTVKVEADEAVDLPAMAGTVTAIGRDSLRFEPRFPLRPGLRYRVLLDTDRPISGVVSLPVSPEPEPSTRVTAIYPSGNELPENLLRFYLHFDAPMTQGDSYRFVSLRDHHGEKVPDTFLELEEELWNSQGTRLTLLFDPGRIKSGLKPKLEVGPALDVGHHFELVVDPQWPDARGVPLVADFRHRFRTVPPDYTLPEPDAWKLSRPRLGTLDVLTVQFDEPLDRALAARLISVEKAGRKVAGSVEVLDGETTWRFRPERPWTDAEHRLTVDVRLEDRAGNRIDRPFERQASQGAMVNADGPATVLLEIQFQP